MKDLNRKLSFDQPDRLFSYWVGALLYRDGMLLVCHDPAEDQYFIPGGYPEFGEYSKAALARVVQEETGAAVNVGRLCILAELFLRQDKPCHQLQLFYTAELKNQDALPDGPFPAYDSLGRPKEDLEFCWMRPEDLEGSRLEPRCIRSYLKQLPDSIIHLVEGE